MINPSLTQRSLQAACALIAGCAVIVYAALSLSAPLWLDEFLSWILLQADSLPKMWSGIASGVDGNPPLYLTAAWLIIRPLPQLVSPIAVLKLVNIGLVVAAIVVLARLGRRVASAAALWIGAVLFVTLNDNVLYVASELRTYALFLFTAAAAVLFQQRLVERHRSRDVSLAALAYVGLALSHTFGIVYVGCIAAAGWLSQPTRRLLRLSVLAVVPAVAAMAAWSPFLLQQVQVVKPYGWMGQPGLPELLETLFASRLSMWLMLVELACVTSAAASALGKDGFDLRQAWIEPSAQPIRYVMLVLGGIAGFTLAGWIAAIVLFPLFVPRYFTPQLIVAFAVHVAFAEWLLRRAGERPAIGLAACALLVPLMAVTILGHIQDASRRQPICSDGEGHFFETEFVQGDLPVIAESPHVFLPRRAYAARGAAYRFPLDWEVVLKYPERARGNAVDFHIMQNLQTWGPMPAVMSTADILRSFPQFLVIEQPGRAWFHHLVAGGGIRAEKLATSAGDQPACTLWKVTNDRLAR